MRTLLAFLVAGPLLAQSAEQLEFYEKKVRPIFATKCYSCHGPKAQMAGLNLSSAEGFARVVVAGDRSTAGSTRRSAITKDQDASSGQAARPGNRRPENMDCDGRPGS